MKQIILLSVAILCSSLLVSCSSQEVDSVATQANNTDNLMNCPVLESSDWNAWLNKIPGTESASLNISAKVVLPSAGYNISLVNGPLDRRQPPTQRVRLDIVKPVSPSRVSPVTQDLVGKLPAFTKSYHSIMIICGDKVLENITDIQTIM